MFKSYLRTADTIKVGDKILHRDVLKGKSELMTIVQIRTGSRYVFDFADKDGRLVDYFAVAPDDVIEIWEDRD